MESNDQGKVFVGGISSEMTEWRLQQYFSDKYGQVNYATIVKDKFTGRSKGFGFIVFDDPSLITNVIRDNKHSIDGRTVEVKRVSRRATQQQDITFNSTQTNKIFVGGLPNRVKKEELRSYFQGYGNVTHVIIVCDPDTIRPRGFGFGVVTFDSVDAVDQVLQRPFHYFHHKLVEVTRDIPKQVIPSAAAIPSVMTTFDNPPVNTSMQVVQTGGYLSYPYPYSYQYPPTYGGYGYDYGYGPTYGGYGYGPTYGGYGYDYDYGYFTNLNGLYPSGLMMPPLYASNCVSNYLLP